MSKSGVFSGSYFPVLRLNTEISVFTPSKGKYGPKKQRKKSVFGHFSHSARKKVVTITMLGIVLGNTPDGREIT